MECSKLLGYEPALRRAFKMNLTIFFPILLAWIALPPLHAQTQGEMAPGKVIDTKFCSPDKIYQIEIIHPKDSENFNGTLVLKKSGHPILRAATMGYITDAYWSPDGKYVAINNRNAESGDYVWVVSLIDGVVVRKPNDNLPEDTTPAKYPEYDNYEVHRQWILAMGWTTQNELHIRIDTIYSNVKDYLRDDLIYTIKHDKLLFMKHTETKKPRE